MLIDALRACSECDASFSLFYFILFFILFMSFIALFVNIHGFYYTI